MKKVAKEAHVDKGIAYTMIVLAALAAGAWIGLTYQQAFGPESSINREVVIQVKKAVSKGQPATVTSKK